MKTRMITVAAIAAFGMQTLAHADCIGNYQGKISQAESNMSGGMVVAAYGVFFLCAPLPFAIGTTVYNEVAKIDMENSLRLLQESEAGRGPEVLSLYRHLVKQDGLGNLTLDQTARAVVTLNLQNAFCAGDQVSSNNDLKDLVEAELRRQ